MPKAMAGIAPIMLIAGVALGSGVTTLLWQAPLEHRLAMVQKANERTEETLQYLNKCMVTLRNVAGLKE